MRARAPDTSQLTDGLYPLAAPSLTQRRPATRTTSTIAALPSHGSR
jgi:hypothetical protein